MTLTLHCGIYLIVHIMNVIVQGFYVYRLTYTDNIN
jgi:hypothetical protein